MNWKPIVGYGGWYEVNEKGDVRSKYRGQWKILRPGIASNGYPTVSLCGMTRTVHSLVADAFLGACPLGQEVRHKDGVRTNSHVKNLEYGTRAENQADRVKHGTLFRGVQYSNAKLNDEKARAIREAKGRISQSQLAILYGVSPAAVQAVHDGRTWTHV